ncbi:winged helix-turn-helix domain-containing protein [Alloacidobacterium sp.]|uniref:winged helix-turn-helix domain-containing protein n=1 Tax=Alloacidobacterium sp. TaxID=2951999 RepID=UPI002D4EBA2A|nr:winged helix-turn-helix domain-containing protein [Alloacidobacterium sp.]HYK34470.1 winged helix-turn-helix domain-containing protein [Alloacidobacterium sp.]
MELKTGSFYECGPFRLEPAEQRLTREGNPVSLTPKAFELLVFLVQNQGRLVTKDQIMRAVWPSSFVEEANLTVSVSVLRKALGEKDGELRYIETVPKRGYRFIASVKEVKSPEATRIQSDEAQYAPLSAIAAGALPESETGDWGHARDGPVLISLQGEHLSSRRMVLSVLAVLACILTVIGYLASRKLTLSVRPAPVQRSLAILPLRNIRQNPKDDFLGFSLADAVITKLGPISSLTVRPSTAIEKYKSQTIDLSKVAAELNVDTLLTGTFIHDGDDLRITYQLIDVKTDNILGRDMIDLKYDKLLTVQDNVTQRIIKGLELNLSPAEEARIKLGEPVNPLAYEYYLRGVDLVGSHNFPLAIKMLEKSVEIDPSYALTWAYLGQSYESAAAFEFGGIEQYRKAQAAYERALTLQPKQLEASMFLANLLVDTGKVEQAVPLLRGALRNNPNNAAVHWELGYAYRFAGMLNESVAECELARQIDPLVKSNGSALNAYLYLGEYDKFLQSLPDVNDSIFVFYRGFGEYHEKKWDLAASDFDRAYSLDPTLYTQIGKAFSYSIARRDPEGLEILRQLENKIQQRGVGDPEGTYKIAQGYAVLGDKASSLRMLRYSIEHGFFPYPYLAADPLLENIRNEPAFSQLINIARKRYITFKSSFVGTSVAGGNQLPIKQN